MGARIEGRVMVHRTDITGGSVGQASLTMTAYAALTSMAPFSKTTSHSTDKKVLPSPHDGRASASCHLSPNSGPMRL